MRLDRPAVQMGDLDGVTGFLLPSGPARAITALTKEQADEVSLSLWSFFFLSFFSVLLSLLVTILFKQIKYIFLKKILWIATCGTEVLKMPWNLNGVRK